MALVRRKDCKCWWISVYRPGQKRLRVSTGTDDRHAAKVIEQTIRLAQSRKTPRSRLVAAIEAMLGPDEHASVRIPVKTLWEAVQAADATSGAPMSPGAAMNRRQACNRFAKWAAEHYPRAETVQDVDRHCAFAFNDWLAKDGAGDKTRANLLGELGTAWRLLMLRTGVAENPWTLARPKAGEGKHGRAFTRAEETAILEAATRLGGDWHDVCQVARYTGLRYGDIAHLRWEAVDLDAGRIRAKPRKTARHGIEMGIPLHPALAAILRARPRDGEWVFPYHASHYGFVRQTFAFRDVLEASGVEANGAHLTFHCWRHTFRTRLSEAGAPEEIAMALGGWTQAATAGLYSHDWGALDKAVKALQG